MQRENVSFIYIEDRDISRAADVLSGIVRHTPVFTSPYVNKKTKADVFFKCENLQLSGSLKFRGAYTAVAFLGEVQQRLGVIANSSGNHARAVALASQMLKVPAMIVLPSTTPPSDIAAVRECGAEILLHEQRENKKIIAELVDKFGWTLIPPAGHIDIVAGAGTAVKELIEEVGPLDYVFVPVRGGGLLYASAVALAQASPDCALVGAVGRQSSLPEQYAKYAWKIATVHESMVQEQMRFFSEYGNFMVEPLGCLGAAALLDDEGMDVAGARVGVILSAGNMDEVSFRRHIAGSTIRIVQ